MTDTERIAALEQEVSRLRAEMGPVVDTGAAQIHERMVQLGNAMNGVVARIEGIPSGVGTVAEYINARISAIQLPSDTDPDPRIPALQTELGKVKASISLIPAGPAGGSGVSNLPGLGQGIAIVVQGAGGVPTVGHAIFGGGGDQGLRILYNHKGYSPTDGSGTHVNPKLMQLRIDFEKDGVISFGYFKPLQDALGNLLPDGPWDGPEHGGKALCIRPGGHNEKGQRGKYTEIYGGLQGRGLRLGVAGATSANAVDDWSLTIEPDGSVKTR